MWRVSQLSLLVLIFATHGLTRSLPVSDRVKANSNTFDRKNNAQTGFCWHSGDRSSLNVARLLCSHIGHPNDNPKLTPTIRECAGPIYSCDEDSVSIGDCSQIFDEERAVHVIVDCAKSAVEPPRLIESDTDGGADIASARRLPRHVSPTRSQKAPRSTVTVECDTQNIEVRISNSENAIRDLRDVQVLGVRNNASSVCVTKSKASGYVLVNVLSPFTCVERISQEGASHVLAFEVNVRSPDDSTEVFWESREAISVNCRLDQSLAARESLHVEMTVINTKVENDFPIAIDIDFFVDDLFVAQIKPPYRFDLNERVHFTVRLTEPLPGFAIHVAKCRAFLTAQPEIAVALIENDVATSDHVNVTRSGDHERRVSFQMFMFNYGANAYARAGEGALRNGGASSFVGNESQDIEIECVATPVAK